MLPSLLPRVKVRQRNGQVYAEYTQEPQRMNWLRTRAERKLPQSEGMMALASEERTARMSGEDTPMAEANALRGGTGEYVPMATETTASKAQSVVSSVGCTIEQTAHELDRPSVDGSKRRTNQRATRSIVPAPFYNTEPHCKLICLFFFVIVFV